MSYLEQNVYQHSLPRNASVHEIWSFPPAMYRPRHLMQFHDQEAFSRTDEEWHGLHVIYVVTSGQARLVSMDSKWTVNTGSAVIRQAGTILQHERTRGSLSPVQGIAIAFEEADNTPLLWPFSSPVSITSRGIAEIASELVLTCSKNEESGPFKSHMLFYQLLDVIRDHSHRSTRDEHSWLSLVIRQIHEMVEHPLTRDQLARDANVSPEHFSREFKKHTGLTFVEYVTRLRIRLAQEHLLFANPTLQELAQLTGYRDIFYLSRKFKQMVGTAPTLYRKTPKKIVSLTYNCTASLLALGYTPHMGAVASWMEEKLVRSGEISFKQHSEYELITRFDLIAESGADVIIGYAPHSSTDELRQIAPTVLLPFEEMDWQEQFLQIGRVTGLENHAKALLSQYDQLQQEANHTLDQRIGTRGSAVCIFWTGEGGAYIYGQGWGRASHILYQSLGFSPPARMEKDGQLLTGYVHVPISDIHLYAADHIFMAYPTDKKERQALEALLGQEPWSSLNAVRNGHVYEIDADMFYGFDPLSVTEQLQDIIHKLTSQLSM
ncbi:ABC transporter substrate-binding protein [Paenibacillus sp. MABNR03]|uniref:ABC transporter substrate-binding protein n=1 Tax=Paenibacillus sp. MABNR03 TaxID=3142626 RepID=UPI003D2876C8